MWFWLMFTFAWASSPNVLIVVADDLGVDRLSTFTPDWYVPGVNDPAVPVDTPVTPALDSLANHGVRFTNAWANPACSPTRAGLLTGQHGYRTGVGSPSNPELDGPTTITLAEELGAAGYTTGLFGKWHLGTDPLGSDWGVVGLKTELANPRTHGFLVFHGHHGGKISDFWYENIVESPGAFGYGLSTVLPKSGYATARTATDAQEFVTVAPEPWFAVLAFNAPHSSAVSDDRHLDEPCTTVVPGMGAPVDAERYRAMVECLDYHTDAVITTLDDVGRLENTIVVFVGDNGTPSAASAVPYPHGDQTKTHRWESGVRVPLIVTEGRHLAGESFDPMSSLVQVGMSSDALVHTSDLFTTVLDLASLTPTAAASELDSTSFADILVSPSLAGKNFNYTEYFQQGAGVTTGFVDFRGPTFKLIVRQEEDPGGGICQRTELYNLTNDRAEANDLSAVRVTQTTNLRNMLEATIIGPFNAAGGSHWLESVNAAVPPVVCPP